MRLTPLVVDVGAAMDVQLDLPLVKAADVQRDGAKDPTQQGQARHLTLQKRELNRFLMTYLTTPEPAGTGDPAGSGGRSSSSCSPRCR